MCERFGDASVIQTVAGFVANKLAKLAKIFKAIHSLAAQLQSFVLYVASYMNTSISMVRN